MILIYIILVIFYFDYKKNQTEHNEWLPSKFFIVDVLIYIFTLYMSAKTSGLSIFLYLILLMDLYRYKIKKYQDKIK